MIIKSFRLQSSDNDMGGYKATFSDGLNVLAGEVTTLKRHIMPSVYATLYTAYQSTGRNPACECGLCGKYNGDFENALPLIDNNREFVTELEVECSDGFGYTIIYEKQPGASVFVSGHKKGNKLTAGQLQDILAPVPLILRASNWNLDISVLAKLNTLAKITDTGIARIMRDCSCICSKLQEDEGDKIRYLSAGQVCMHFLEVWADKVKSDLSDLKGFVMLTEPFICFDNTYRLKAAEVLRSIALEKQIIVAVRDYDAALFSGGKMIDVA